MRRLLLLILTLSSVIFISCNTADDTTMYDVTVSMNPSEAGTVSPSADSSYEEGEEITLRVDPSDEYLFEQWSGDKESSDRSLTVMVDQDYSITANFKVKEYELATSTKGEGSVYEEVVEKKSQEYEHGTVVELTAEPDQGWEFVEWQGDITGTENPAEITVDNTKEVTAVFEQTQFTLDISSGNNQYGPPGTELNEPLVVQVLDQNKEPASDVLVNFDIVEGKGSINPQEVKTGENGMAEAFLQLSNDLSPVTVKAKTVDLPEGVETDEVEFQAVAESELTEWLDKQERLMDAINWVTPDGLVNYRNWSEEQKADLNEMYMKVISNSLNMENYPPENLYSDYNVRTHYTEEDAWELYLMNIANSLAIEKSNEVGWSIRSDRYTESDLEILLDGETFFYYQKYGGEGVYQPVTGGRLGARVLPAQPNYVMDFLESEGILTSDPLETIYRLIDWSAVNMVHFSGQFIMGNIEDHWHYGGAIPVDRIMDGTVREGDEEKKHFTAGCHGTNQFYMSVLRVVNIPVEYIKKANHATPHFPVQNLYMSHGDDPYNAFYARKPAIHPQELLLDKATFQEWFGRQNDSETISSNIGRRTTELGVKHLSYYLLQRYCGDKEAGVSKEEGDVYEILSRYYSMSELEEMNLWGKMDEKLSSIGGCENIDNERPPYF